MRKNTQNGTAATVTIRSDGLLDLTTSNWALKKLEELAISLSNSDRYHQEICEINSALRHIDNHTFSFVIVGEFKKGKSTFINALLGVPVLPADILPATATINRVRFGAIPQAVIRFKNKQEYKINEADLADYVTKLTVESAKQSADIQEAVLHYPLELCRNGVEFIDTPGLNDDDAMTAVTLSAIQANQAVIMVTSATAPFAESESLFLCNTLLSKGIRHIVFVVNGIDLIRKTEDVERLLASVQKRIASSIEDWVAQQYGRETANYAECLRTIGETRVFGLSAQQALTAKQSDNHALLEQSRFVDFERELTVLVTEKRAQISHETTVNAIRSCAERTRRTLKENARVVDADSESLIAEVREATTQVAQIRDYMKAEFNTITQNIARIRKAALSIAVALPGDLISKSEKIVDEVLQKPAQEATLYAADQISTTVLLTSAQAEAEITAQVKEGVSNAIKHLKILVKTFNQSVIDLQRCCPQIKATQTPFILSQYTSVNLAEEQSQVQPLYDLTSVDLAFVKTQLAEIAQSHAGGYVAAGATVGTFLGGPIGAAVGGAIAVGYQKKRIEQEAKKKKPLLVGAIKAQIDGEDIRDRTTRYINREFQNIGTLVTNSKQDLSVRLREADQELSTIQGAKEAERLTHQRQFDALRADLDEITQFIKGDTLS